MSEDSQSPSVEFISRGNDQFLTVAHLARLMGLALGKTFLPLVSMVRCRPSTLVSHDIRLEYVPGGVPVN